MNRSPTKAVEISLIACMLLSVTVGYVCAQECGTEKGGFPTSQPFEERSEAESPDSEFEIDSDLDPAISCTPMQLGICNDHWTLTASQGAPNVETIFRRATRSRAPPHANL